MTSDRESLVKQLKSALSARDKLREQKAGYGMRVPVDLELELEKKEAELTKLEAEVSRLDAECYRQRIAELEREVEKYPQQIEELQQQVARSEEDRQGDRALAERCLICLSKLTSLLEQQNRNSVNKISQLEQRIADLEMERETLQQHHQQKVCKQEQQLEGVRSHLKALNLKYRQLKQENNQLKAIPTQPEPLPQTPPPKLKSDRGIDYTRLHKFLVEGRWKEADEETSKIMLKIAGKEEKGWLDTKDIDRFPRTDLRTIDCLWIYHSDGHFGFSVQSEIYRRHGGTRERSNSEIWHKFSQEVGWYVGCKYVGYNKLNFSLQAVRGHLPRFMTRSIFCFYEKLSG